MDKLLHWINLLNKTIGKGISLFTILLILIVCVDVALRYFFNFSTAGITELEWHIFGCIFLLNAPNTLLMNKHVRVDALYQKFSDRNKRWVDIFGILFFLIPFCLFVIHASIPYVYNSWVIMEKSTDAGGLHFRFIIKAIIPISMSLLLLQGVSLMLSKLFELKGTLTS
ncbi:TRAP transporter small permease subunit [Flammeovirga sp. MY04]|uniref:TRAP transporter small permease subunit n=1 Tax=Flammeovirga sp. MY04 TaxID=1191459 RepID=UPI0008061630|nr:TRAP transporter small permease subunit [Flammeovirga sp. MY04]ANQ48884.1 TRAP transporter small permease subunit [Flammeovirga sp. MY04]